MGSLTIVEDFNELEDIASGFLSRTLATMMDQWPENYNAIAEFETLPEKLADAGYNTGYRL